MRIVTICVATAALVAATVVASTNAKTADRSGKTATRSATLTASREAARERPRGAVEDCSTSQGWPGGSAREFTSRQNLVVGPLALKGARVMLGYAVSVGGNKLLLHVRGETPSDARAAPPNPNGRRVGVRFASAGNEGIEVEPSKYPSCRHVQRVSGRALRAG